MSGRPQIFTMRLTSGRRGIDVQFDPPSDLLERFLMRDLSDDTFMRRDLVEAADRAKTGKPSNNGSNNFGIAFDSDGVTLEHNYLEGEPSVTVDLDNFIDIVTAYSAAAVEWRAQRRSRPAPAPDSDHVTVDTAPRAGDSPNQPSERR